MKIKLLFVFSFLFSLQAYAQLRNYNLEVSATARYYNSTQSILDFRWRYVATPTPRFQRVYRKTKASYDFGSIYRNLANTDSTFSDTITTGSQFEYRFEKDSAADGYSIFGLINAGARVAFPTNRGTILLLIDSTNKAYLDTSIRTYRNDLIGDGYKTKVIYLSTSTTVAQIKTNIVNAYTADNTINSVVLIGDLAVPYSGDFRASGIPPPDGHTTTIAPPSHEGAWPADCFYGDINGTWTDATVTNNLGARAANNNNTGDGKYDQTEIPSLIDLQVGRIDLSNMTSFTLTERQLLRQYFIKNHNFRHKIDIIEERTLLDDQIGFLNYPYPFKDEYFGGPAYQNSAPLFGQNTVTTGNYLSTLSSNSYLWSYGIGYGNYTLASGVGTTASFSSATQIKSVFTGLFGSYFGDWDNANNFLRAPLAAKGNVLNSFWSERPAWHFHHMAMGETIGYGTLRSQNNWTGSNLLYPHLRRGGTTFLYNELLIHQNLMGDPAVRMQPVIPAINFVAVQDSCSPRFKLKWQASTDTAVHDYYIFRARHIDSTFSFLGSTQSLTYTDATPLSGNNVYMLRGMKLQVSGSGTYFNMSQGLFDTINTSNYYIPIANAGRDTAVCTNTFVRIGQINNNSLNTQYTWLPASFNRDTTTILANSSGNKILLATDTSTKCSVRDTMVLSLNPLPLVETISNTSNSCRDSVIWSSTFNNGSSFQYQWNFTTGFPNTASGLGLNTPDTIGYNTTGNKTTILTVRNTTTNCLRIDSSTVNVGCISLPIFITNFNCIKTIENYKIRFYNTKEIEFSSFYLEILNNKNEWTLLQEIPNQLANEYEIVLNSNVENKAIRLIGKLQNGKILNLEICNGSEFFSEIKIYPNPVEQFLNIQFAENYINKNISILILDIYGRKILNNEFNLVQNIYHLDLNKFISGEYFIQINALGKQLNYKIIKL